MKTLAVFSCIFLLALPSLAQEKQIKSTRTVVYAPADTTGNTHGKRMPYVNADYVVYNTDGTMQSTQAFNADSAELIRTNYTYDASGYRLKEESWIKGKRVSTTSYSYNAKNNLVKEEYEYPEFSIKTTTRYHYNKQQMCIAKTKSSGGIVTDSIAYLYNPKGALLQEIFYSFSSGKPVLTTRHYMAADSLVRRSELYDSQGVLTKTYEWQYDSQDNKTEEKCTDARTGAVTFIYWKYTFDSNSNWTRQVQFNGSKIFSVTERAVVYY